MSTKSPAITILVDNTAGPGLVGEHGLSLWLETGDCNILFDTGQGTALPLNAKKLGIRMESVDILVLSHGHYDHTGGVFNVLQDNPGVDVYCHPAAVQPRYSLRNGVARPIHMPRSAMAAIDKIPSPQMHWISRPTAISKTIGLTGPIPRLNGYEGPGGPFFLDPTGRRPDPIEDDMALWIATPKGLVVLVGCCHAGLANTLEHIRHISGMDTIAVLIGGFHLFQADRQRIASTISGLRQLSPRIIVPCHCTDDKAVEALSDAFPDQVTPGAAGLRMAF